MVDDNKFKSGYTESNTFGRMGRPLKYSSKEELRATIQEYFTTWQENKRPITVAGLCCYLGIAKDTLWRYENDEKYDFSDTVKEAKLYIENDKLEKGLLGFYNPTIASLDLSANHGYYTKTKNESDNVNKTLNVTPDDLSSEDDPLELYKVFKKENDS